VKAIVGNKFVPSLADRYLARSGYETQQYDGPENSNCPNNLYEPLPGDHGAFGHFDNRAHNRSFEL
jgi:hypothetical protein